MSKSPIKKVAMLFAGGPAPAANAVIGTAAFAFLNDGIELLVEFCVQILKPSGDRYFRI